jgi:hypothetical protein
MTGESVDKSGGVKLGESGFNLKEIRSGLFKFMARGEARHGSGIGGQIRDLAGPMDGSGSRSRAYAFDARSWANCDRYFGGELRA